MTDPHPPQGRPSERYTSSSAATATAPSAARTVAVSTRQPREPTAPRHHPAPDAHSDPTPRGRIATRRPSHRTTGRAATPVTSKRTPRRTPRAPCAPRPAREPAPRLARRAISRPRVAAGGAGCPAITEPSTAPLGTTTGMPAPSCTAPSIVSGAEHPASVGSSHQRPVGVGAASSWSSPQRAVNGAVATTLWPGATTTTRRADGDRPQLGDSSPGSMRGCLHARHRDGSTSAPRPIVGGAPFGGRRHLPRASSARHTRPAGRPRRRPPPRHLGDEEPRHLGRLQLGECAARADAARVAGRARGQQRHGMETGERARRATDTHDAVVGREVAIACGAETQARGTRRAGVCRERHARRGKTPSAKPRPTREIRQRRPKTPARRHRRRPQRGHGRRAEQRTSGRRHHAGLIRIGAERPSVRRADGRKPPHATGPELEARGMRGEPTHAVANQHRASRHLLAHPSRKPAGLRREPAGRIHPRAVAARRHRHHPHARASPRKRRAPLAHRARAGARPGRRRAAHSRQPTPQAANQHDRESLCGRRAQGRGRRLPPTTHRRAQLARPRPAIHDPPADPPHGPCERGGRRPVDGRHHQSHPVASAGSGPSASGSVSTINEPAGTCSRARASVAPRSVGPRSPPAIAAIVDAAQWCRRAAARPAPPRIRRHAPPPATRPPDQGSRQTPAARRRGDRDRPWSPTGRRAA